MDEATLWTTGELAEKAGVSVRTLRYYDQIALLAPSERSAGGHRRYSSGDVARLYRILALRELRFSLADIAAALDAEPQSLLGLVRAQLTRVDSDVARLAGLQGRLRQLAETLKEQPEASPEELLTTMEAMMNVRLDRIYTAGGDSGETDLADGRRAAKSDPTLGAADLEEVSAHLAAAIGAGPLGATETGWLRRIQNDLLDLGSDLAHPFAENDGAKRIDASYVEWLEDICERANGELDPLSTFALPDGGAPAPQLHLARIVCRRVERQVVAIADVNPEVVRYLNRLSDLLFILARQAAAPDELLWQPGAHAPAQGSVSS